MAASQDYSQVADRLTQLAIQFDGESENFSSAQSDASSALDELDRSWGGPLADAFLPAARTFVDTAGTPASHSGTIADALRTLAGEAARISGDLSVLENADEPDTEAIGTKSGEWQQAASRFSTTTGDAVAGLERVDGLGLVLPGPRTDAEYATAVIEELGGSDAIDELIQQLAEDNDADGFQLIADTFGLSLHGLSAEEIKDAMTGIDARARQLLLMASDTLPPEITEFLISEEYLTHLPIGGHTGDLGTYENAYSREFLAAVTGLDLTGDDPYGEWARGEVALWEKILALDPSSVELVAGLPGGRHYGVAPIPLRQATINHLTAHPEALDGWLDFGVDIPADSEAAVTKLMEVLYPAGYDGEFDQVVASYTAHATADVYVTVEDIVTEFPDIGSEQAAQELALERTRENLERAGRQIGILQSSAEDAGIEIDLAGVGRSAVDYGVGFIPVVGNAYGAATIVTGNIDEGANRSGEAREAYQSSLPLAFDVVTGGLPESQREQIIDELGFELADGHVVVGGDVDIDALIDQHPEHAAVLLYANEFADGMQSGGAS